MTGVSLFASYIPVMSMSKTRNQKAQFNQEPVFWWCGESAPSKNWFLILLRSPRLWELNVGWVSDRVIYHLYTSPLTDICPWMPLKLKKLFLVWLRHLIGLLNKPKAILINRIEPQNILNDHYEAIAKSQIPELANLDIDLLTNCIAIAQTSRLEASNTFRNAIKKR